jgi:hypothetical protein
MFFPGSRYENSTIGIFRWGSENRRIIPMLPNQLSVNDLQQDQLIYEMKADDELDELAQRYGDNFQDYWKIADVNHITYPLEQIPSGTLITIPGKRFFVTNQNDNLVIFGR